MGMEHCAVCEQACMLCEEACPGLIAALQAATQGGDNPGRQAPIRLAGTWASRVAKMLTMAAMLVWLSTGSCGWLAGV